MKYEIRNLRYCVVVALALGSVLGSEASNAEPLLRASASAAKVPLTHVAVDHIEKLEQQAVYEKTEGVVGEDNFHPLNIYENECPKRGKQRLIEAQFTDGEPVFPRLSQEWVRLSWVSDVKGVVAGLTSDRMSGQPGALFIATRKQMQNFELALEGFPVLVDRDATQIMVLYQEWGSQQVRLVRVDMNQFAVVEPLVLPRLPGVPRELVTLNKQHYLQVAKTSGAVEVVRLAADGSVDRRYRTESAFSHFFKAGGALYVADSCHCKAVQLDHELNIVQRLVIQSPAPKAKPNKANGLKGAQSP